MSTAKVAVVNINGISYDSPWARVFPGDGLKDSCHRRRNRLETCLKNRRNVDKNTVFYLIQCCRARKKHYFVRFFSKNTCTYLYCWSMEKVKTTCPQNEKEQIRPPGTKFSNFSDQIAVHNLSFHFSTMHQTNARARKGSKTRLRHFFKAKAISK